MAGIILFQIKLRTVCALLFFSKKLNTKKINRATLDIQAITIESKIL